MSVLLIQCFDPDIESSSTASLEGLTPTGSWANVTKDWVSSKFNHSMATSIILKGHLNVPLSIWVKLGLPTVKPIDLNTSELAFKEVKFE